MSVFGDPKLDALLEQAKQKWANLSPAEKKAMTREHAIDWMYGEACIGLNDTFPAKHLSREECAAIYDRMHPEDEVTS